GAHQCAARPARIRSSDADPLRRPFARRCMTNLTNLLRTVLPPVIVFVLLMAAAEMFIKWRSVPNYLVPKPSDVWKIFADDDQRMYLLGSLGTTAKAALIGFAASAGAGAIIAILLSTSRLVQRAFYPYTVFFQTVPIIAIAPLLVIWFGP